MPEKLVSLDDVRIELTRLHSDLGFLRARVEEAWVRAGTARYLLQKLGEEMPFPPEDDGKDVDKGEG